MTRPGRKRSEESRQAILTAATDLVAEVGYAGLSIEGIAARSGAGKQTVYRWWPSKADVLLEALAAKAELHIPIPDKGSWPADLHAFLAATFRLGRHLEVIELLRALMAEAQINSAFGDRFREGFLQRRRAALGVLVDRAAARGELPSDLRPGTVADLVFGVVWYRVLATREPADDTLVNELVSVLT